QLYWLWIPGRSQRTWTHGHRAVNVPDAHASRHERSRSSAPEGHRSEAESALSARTIRKHRGHELRRALAERGPSALTRRQHGRVLHEYRRGLAVALPRRGRL